MPQNSSSTSPTSIVPLLVNGLQGRMLRLEAPRRHKREILIVYGQQATLERWTSFAKELNQYGAVTMPDLPGFGGMQTFYRIHEKPTVDTFADYLAALVKLRFRNKRFTIVGIGFGFVVATRMLQRYPDLAKKVNVVINVSGIARYDDLTLKPPRRQLKRLSYRFLATYLPALFIRHICWHPTLLLAWHKRHKKPTAVAREEVNLWRRNDVRTYFRTTAEMLKLDNCQQAVKLSLWHVAIHANKNIDSQHLSQHLRVIYGHVEEVRSRLRSQTIGTVQYRSQTTHLLPVKIHQALS